jgi:hypothetical protein
MYVAMTSHKHGSCKIEVAEKIFSNAAECKYKFVHTEIVQVFRDINWISLGAFEIIKGSFVSFE